MKSNFLDETIIEIKNEREKIWVDKPEDIKFLRQKKGTKNQNFTIVMYANSDTQAMVKYLFNLLEVSKQNKLDINTIKQITIQFLTFDCRKMKIYYDLINTSLLIDKTIEALKIIKNLEEYKMLIKEFLLFLGKINYWIDLEIPWRDLADSFETK